MNRAAVVTQPSAVGEHTPVPFARLVRVEIRKCLDTRAALTLIASFLAVGTIALVLVLVASPEPTLALAALPAALLAVALPLLGVLVMTSEWSQRTALVTFWLVPRRSRVLGAKVVATLLTGAALLAVTVVVFLLVSVLVLAVRGEPLRLQDAGSGLAPLLAAGMTGVVFGLAWGALLPWTPVAVLVVVLVPLAVDPLLAVALGDRATWFSSGAVQDALLGGSTPVPALLSSLTLWYVLPLAAGWWVQLRREAR
ncbi:ABC transporter permease [Cellulomonas sp. JZ18]|uniref:ABC transporter permease n=1 Tax=Cellulomonas sp. JZ18 TaxID=2654191 RepID=UPI0012D3F0AF|nr:ABC transporter permease [Cellulomonas sp. JZ18]QGQ19723.1 ABC transporter permease [Cellulomonas sp. JZ18]